MATPLIPLNDGTSIPFIAYGTGTALFGKDAKDGVTQAIQTGFRHIDAAQLYNNEASVGEGIAAAGVPRAELYITTKLGTLAPGQTVRDTLVESLKKFKTDYVDLFLIHMPIQHKDLKDVWRQFEEVKKEGLTKSIGVSNFQPKHLKEVLEVATIPPAANQIEYHPYVFKASEPIFEVQAEKKIVATSFGGLSPIIRGSGGPLDPVLKKVAKRVSEPAGRTVTEGQVLQLWLRKKGIPAVTTTSKVERLQEYLAVGSLPDLTDAEVAEIDQVGSTVHHRYFSKWIDEEK